MMAWPDLYNAAEPCEIQKSFPHSNSSSNEQQVFMQILEFEPESIYFQKSVSGMT